MRAVTPPPAARIPPAAISVVATRGNPRYLWRHAAAAPRPSGPAYGTRSRNVRCHSMRFTWLPHSRWSSSAPFEDVARTSVRSARSRSSTGGVARRFAGSGVGALPGCAAGSAAGSSAGVCVGFVGRCLPLGLTPGRWSVTVCTHIGEGSAGSRACGSGVVELKRRTGYGMPYPSVG
jgi:hypothetical protein